MGVESSQFKILEDYPNNPIRFHNTLTTCIKEKDNIQFQSIIQKLKDPQDARDCRGASLLHVSAEYGNAEVTKYLIAMSFDVNLQDEYGRTALMIALKKQHFSTAKILLESNADIMVCDTFGINALITAVTMDSIVSPSKIPSLDWRYPYWQIVAMIFDKVDAYFSSDSEKIAEALIKIHCPLTHMVFMKNSNVMKIMMERGCSINARNRFTGFTALHLAICFWKLEKVKLLLDYGADVNILDYRKTTPFMCIYYMTLFLDKIRTCEVELVDILLKHKPKIFGTGNYNAVNQMHDLFRLGTKDAIRLALEHNPDLFLARYVTNHSLLHIIAKNSNPGIEEVLKGRNMEVDSKDGRGNTALSVAVNFQNDNIVLALLGEGASLDVHNHDGMTPMHLSFEFENFVNEPAMIKMRLKCIKVMLEHGGDPEITFRNGDTILDVVARNEVIALAEPVLAQFALRKILDVPISEVICKQIQAHKGFDTYFNSVVNELREAKTSIIWRSVSLFEFLTASDEKILIYARNRGLVLKLTNLIDRFKLDSYFMGILRRRCTKIAKISELRKRAADIVRQNIGKFFEFNSVITKIIVDYFDDEDVRKLLE